MAGSHIRIASRSGGQPGIAQTPPVPVNRVENVGRLVQDLR